MLYREDIETALARGTIRDIETAFRALVGWPHEEDVEEPNEELLRDVCLGLSTDTSIMPDGTVEAIQGVLEKLPSEGLQSRSYDDGAQAVLTSLLWFAAKFKVRPVETYRDHDGEG